eukprot:GHVL01006820.1.p1 GENE.GHVL01006820.1~~GHVL01006820.1.p1  ORF type:complete len:161 (+),score=58.44 GHVL01006820.1:130-612(+)
MDENYRKYVKNLSDDEVENIKYFFEIFSKNGKLEYFDLFAVLQKFSKKKVGGGVKETDKKKKLGLDEGEISLKNLLIALDSTKTDDDNLIFSEFDLEKDNQISKSDIQKIGKILDGKGGGDSSDLVTALDLTDDSHKISEKEFSSLMRGETKLHRWSMIR